MPHSTLPDWMAWLPPWATSATLWLIGASVYAGRLMYHAEEVRAGRRRFWSRDLLLDLPVVAGMSFLTWGLVEHWGLSTAGAVVLGPVLGWLGPRGTRAMIEVWLRLKLRKDPTS